MNVSILLCIDINRTIIKYTSEISMGFFLNFQNINKIIIDSAIFGYRFKNKNIQL